MAGLSMRLTSYPDRDKEIGEETRAAGLIAWQGRMRLASRWGGVAEMSISGREDSSPAHAKLERIQGVVNRVIIRDGAKVLHIVLRWLEQLELVLA